MLRRLNPRSAIGVLRARREARRLERQLPLVAQVLGAHLQAGRSLRQAISESAADLPEPSRDRIAPPRLARVWGRPGGGAGDARSRRGRPSDAWLRPSCIPASVAIWPRSSKVSPKRCMSVRPCDVRRRLPPPRRGPPAGLVSAMPLVAMAALWLLDRPALTALLVSPLGWAALAFSAVLVLVGHMLIARIAAVDP